MPSERYVTTKELFTKTVNILLDTVALANENTKRHVDDNRLTLTKEQSHVRMIYLLIVLSTCLGIIDLKLISLSNFSNNAKQGVYFYENITEKEHPMRKQKLVLIHGDGTTQKLGL